MPVATNTQAVKNERDLRLRAALKNHVLAERQKNKEAEDEMERLRKEFEEKEREKDAELTENRLELIKVDKRIEELRNQKEQLCFQLKKKIANNQPPEKKFEPTALRVIQQQYDQDQKHQQHPQQQQPKHNQAIHTPMYASQVPRTSSQQQPPPTLVHHQQTTSSAQQQQPPQPPQHLQQQSQIIQPNQQHIIHKGMNNSSHVQQQQQQQPQPPQSTIVGSSNRRTIHFPDDLNDKSAYLHVNPPIKRGRSTSPPHQPQPPQPQPQHQNLQSMYKGSPYQTQQPQAQKHQLWSKPSQPSQPHHPSQQPQKPQQQYAIPPGAYIFPSNSLPQIPGHHPGPPPSQSDVRSSRENSNDSGRGQPMGQPMYMRNYHMEMPPHPHYSQGAQHQAHIYLANSNDKRPTHIQSQQSQQQQSQHSSSPSAERGHSSSQHHHQQQQQHHSQQQHHHQQQQQQQQQPKSMPSPKTVWPYDKNQKLPGFHRMEYSTDSIDMTRTPPLQPQQPPSPQSSRWRKQGQPPPSQGPPQHMPMNSYKFVHQDKFMPIVDDRYIEMMVAEGRSSPPTRYICHDGVLTSLHTIPKGFSFQSNNSQISKTGSITQGYPGRSSSMHPQQPPQMAGQPPQSQQQQPQYKHMF